MVKNLSECNCRLLTTENPACVGDFSFPFTCSKSLVLQAFWPFSC